MTTSRDDVGRFRRKRGFVDPKLVRAGGFWATTVCILVAASASLLAIWEFSGTQILWRTVASCAVIVGGILAFAFFNSVFGSADE